MDHKDEKVVARINQLLDQGELSNGEIARKITKEFSLEAGFNSVKSKIWRMSHRRKMNDRDDLAGVVQAAKEAGVDLRDLKFGWLKNDNASLFFTNPEYDDGSITREKVEDMLSGIIEKHQNFTPLQFTPLATPAQRVAQLVISDAHIGMDPGDGALFQYEYNADIYKQSLDRAFHSVIKEASVYGNFDELWITDLGDMGDGWNALTTRGGHELPQNMTNAEVFNVAVDSFVSLIRNLAEAKICNKIKVRVVTNDNHTGDFAQMIHLAVKKIINLMFSKDMVEIDIIYRFMEHRFYGDHCFIYTHGKDKKYMTRGLPLDLNDKAIKFINDYIDHYEIRSKYIHVLKGDLHQIGYSRTKKFDYTNFMSFAPPSSWIQHNFADSYSGYSIQIIEPNNNEVKQTNYFIEYKKTRK